MQCDSGLTADQSSSNCVLAAAHITPTECPQDSNGTCFLRILNGHTSRGCFSTLPADVRTQCLSASDSLCTTCINVVGSDGGCNNYVRSICVINFFFLIY